MANNIPIHNIYYMLSYCAGILPEVGETQVTNIDETELVELFAGAFVRRLNGFIKRGFYKEYVVQQESSSAIRGKILFKESVATAALTNAKLVCQYDVFSENIVHNQILKATIHTLIKHPTLKKPLKLSLKKMYPYFQHVTLIQLERQHFHQIQLHKQNQNYHIMLEICRIIYEHYLIDEESGKLTFVDFMREGRMHYVFEGFVRNFYRLEQRQYKVYRETLSWQVGEILAGEQGLIPKMQTDICLSDSTTKIIIDTKFHNQPLARNYYEEEKIKSENLYQIYSYLSNSLQYDKMVGILLYPQIDKEVHQVFEMNNYLIKVVTVDLAQSWQYIKERLLGIINDAVE